MSATASDSVLDPLEGDASRRPFKADIDNPPPIVNFLLTFINVYVISTTMHQQTQTSHRAFPLSHMSPPDAQGTGGKG